MTEQVSSQSCEICSSKIRVDNQVGICSTNPICRSEKRHKFWCMKNDVVYVRQLETKFCEICGKKLRRHKPSGICTSTRRCTTEGKRKMDALRVGKEYKPLPVKSCDICNKSLDTRNNTGVCRATPRCMREYARRRGYNKRVRTRTSVNHCPLTYLMYSPGLNAHKIGYSANLSSRLTSLRCGCFDIALVTTFPYGRKLETWLHDYFHDNRIPGTEWFTDITETDVKNAVAEFELENEWLEASR